MHEKVTLVVAKLWLPTHYVHIIFFCRPDVDCIQLEKYKKGQIANTGHIQGHTEIFFNGDLWNMFHIRYHITSNSILMYDMIND